MLNLKKVKEERNMMTSTFKKNYCSQISTLKQDIVRFCKEKNKHTFVIVSVCSIFYNFCFIFYNFMWTEKVDFLKELLDSGQCRGRESEIVSAIISIMKS